MLKPALVLTLFVTLSESFRAPARAPITANFFAQLTAPKGLPKNYAQVYSQAIAGVSAALDKRERGVEVDFPPIEENYGRGDGSASTQRRVDTANNVFVGKLVPALSLGRKVVVLGGGRSFGGRGIADPAARAEAERADVCVVVAPALDGEWRVVEQLVALPGGKPAVVVVNGLAQNGILPHAYFYRPMTARSVRTGAVVRRYPGEYEAFNLAGVKAPVAVPLAQQGNRRLPNTGEAQMYLFEKS